MRVLLLVLAATLGCGLATPSAQCDESEGLTAPPTRRENVVERIHGARVADPYRWLERIDEPEVAEWTRAQNTHARAWLERQPGREASRQRLLDEVMVEGRTAPVKRGGRMFFARWAAADDRPTYYVADANGANERALVDPNKLGPSRSIRQVQPSPTGKFVTYLEGANAADHAVLRILDVESGSTLGESIPGARYAWPSWRPDDSGFYYTGLPSDPSIPPPELPGHAAVKLHEVGTASDTDAFVFGPLGDPRRFVQATLSPDGRWLTVTVLRGFGATDVYLRREVAGAEFTSLAPGRDALYDVTVHRDRLFIHTNDGAPRYRVLTASADAPTREHWREIVPQQSGTLRSLQILGDRLALTKLERAHSRLEFRDLDGGSAKEVKLPGTGTIHALQGSPESDEAFVSYTAFDQPLEILTLQPSTAEAKHFWSRPRPDDAPEIVTEQVWVPSKDGTPVSMFVVHRADLERDGQRPTVLTGYGGFGIALTPGYSPLTADWVARGGVWAVPNLRGGGEYGEDWHEAGRRHEKQNTFDDFIAAAQWLQAEGYTDADRLAIRGGSNGGLLVGAAMTQRPELFGAVICAVPLLDMVRYTRFGSGPTWIGEYGDPDDPTDFATLFAYSPYHRLHEGADYPALLMLSADSDDRVDPMHARKFIAAARWASGSDAPMLLRVEGNAGHGGADRRRQQVEALVDTVAFLEATVGTPAR